MKTRYKYKIENVLVRKAVGEAMRKALLRAAMLVERDAKQSMRKGGGRAHEPSDPGIPPHVQTGNLRASIQSAYDNKNKVAVVGPTKLAPYGKWHEFGGARLPKRPYMRPALLRQAPNFSRLFKSLELDKTTTGRLLNAKKGGSR